MKNALLTLFMVVTCFIAHSQSYYFAWDGYGFATSHNYSLTYGYGSYQYKPVTDGLGLGFMEINQNYDLYYNNEGGGHGSNMRIQTNYYYLSPMTVFQCNKSGSVQCYATLGLGFAQGAMVEQHKWSNTTWSTTGQPYDSVIDRSDAVNTMVLRFGLGFAEFYPLGGNFHLFFNQDFGFMMTPMINTSDKYFEEGTNAAPTVRPIMFSLRFGIAFITHSRDTDQPYRIRKLQNL